MRALARLPVELAVQAALVFTVVAVACGSNWSIPVRSIAGPLRWLGLFVFCLAALAYALETRADARVSWWYAPPAALVGLAFFSTGWSVDPRLTFGRAVTFGALIVAAAALSVAVSMQAAERVLLAVLVGALSVAFIGLVIYAVAPGDAVQDATGSIPARFRGLGQNPNTDSMLWAVAMPIAAWQVLRATSRRGRLLGVAAFALLAGVTTASGSRGALVCGFLASIVPALAAPGSRRVRLASAALFPVLLVAAVAITKLPKPLSPEAARKQGTPIGYYDLYRPHDANYGGVRIEDDIGRPPPGYHKPAGRGLFSSSGRTEAWRGAIDQALERPGVGYGFGTEDRVFVDRYYAFEGGLPENSYVGLFLQVGIVGLAVFAGLVVTFLAAGVRALRRADAERLPAAAACLAVLLAGLGLGVVQSYLYSVGNTATLSVWVCAFVLISLCARRRTPA